MHEKQIRTITALVADALAEQKLPFAKDKKAALELLRTPGWAEELSQLLPIRRRLECGEVLEVCTPILPKLSPVPEEGWLAFCYRYVRSILYPEGNFAPDAAEYEDGARFYLTVLQVLLDQERAVMPFDPLVDFQFLTPQEYESCDCGREYARFLHHFRTEYVYELMRLGQEVTPFRTLGHIAGVHYIAMTAARGLQAAGVDIDLALISGAAASHDIGKYGCRPGERVPYLHYYYTDQWLLERNMGNISHIAANGAGVPVGGVPVPHLRRLPLQAGPGREGAGDHRPLPPGPVLPGHPVQAGQRGQQQAPPVRVRLRQAPRL